MEEGWTRLDERKENLEDSRGREKEDQNRVGC
jgi:hypothetical protein